MTPVSGSASIQGTDEAPQGEGVKQAISEARGQMYRHVEALAGNPDQHGSEGIGEGG